MSFGKFLRSKLGVGLILVFVLAPSVAAADTVRGGEISFSTTDLTVRGGEISFSTPDLTVRGGEETFYTGLSGSISLNGTVFETGKTVSVSGEVFNGTDRIGGSVSLESTAFESNSSFSFSSGTFSRDKSLVSSVGEHNVTAYISSNGENFNVSKELQITENELGLSNADPEGVNVDPGQEIDISVNVSGDNLDLSFYNVPGNSPVELRNLKGVSSGVKTVRNAFDSLSEDRTYSWKVNVSNDFYTVSKTYTFTTHGIKLDIDHPQRNELGGFKLYSNASGSWKKLKSVNKKADSKKVYNRELDSREYTCYKLTAFNSFGESPPAKDCVKP